jgi:hypothetical protein
MIHRPRLTLTQRVLFLGVLWWQPDFGFNEGRGHEARFEQVTWGDEVLEAVER